MELNSQQIIDKFEKLLQKLQTTLNSDNLTDQSYMDIIDELENLKLTQVNNITKPSKILDDMLTLVVNQMEGLDLNWKIKVVSVASQLVFKVYIHQVNDNITLMQETKEKILLNVNKIRNQIQANRNARNKLVFHLDVIETGINALQNDDGTTRSNIIETAKKIFKIAFSTVQGNYEEIATNSLELIKILKDNFQNQQRISWFQKILTLNQLNLTQQNINEQILEYIQEILSEQNEWHVTYAVLDILLQIFNFLGELNNHHQITTQISNILNVLNKLSKTTQEDKWHIREKIAEICLLHLNHQHTVIQQELQEIYLTMKLQETNQYVLQTLNSQEKFKNTRCCVVQIIVYFSNIAETRTCTDTFTGHLQSVTALYFSKDNILYSGSHDQTIKQWGKNSKSCIQTYYGHHDCISSIFECNNYIYSASWDKTIKIWRKDQDKSLQTLYGHSDIIQTLCISQDGKYICSGSQDKTVKLWQINKYNNCWECQNTYMGHLSRITCVQIFTQHNTQHNIHVPKIISGSRDNNIKILEIYQGKIQLNQFYNNDYDPITLIKFSDDGQYVCSASINGILKLWNVQSGQSQIIINTHTNCITALCFSFDCQYICSGTDKSINVWETKTGKCKYVFQEISRGINSICFSQDGQFVCAGFNNIIKLWLIENGQCSHKFIQNIYIQIKQVCISQQNILYAVINNLKLDCYQVYQWNLSQQDNNKEEIFEFTENMKTIQQIFLATNGNYLCYIQNQSLIVKQLGCLEFICGIIDQKDVINADIIVSQNIFYVQIIYRDQQACLVVLERTYQQKEQQQINTLLSKITIQKNTFIEIRSLKYSHLRVNHIIWLKQQYAIYIMF
ncbi:Pentapeptide_repeats-containing protein [Hexamita inflata]|uniref:Pentapeptide repeats-containing protein n=1 Tax=Hexamita inflata TaxID=28002 RepID=A0AA86UI80_9EUKA|nr:Pentapeptide repeats-containing protein [Hexamita inflata]